MILFTNCGVSNGIAMAVTDNISGSLVGCSQLHDGGGGSLFFQ